MGKSGRHAGRLFLGEFEHALDEKNRLMIPSRLRDPVGTGRDGQGLYVARWFEHSLSLYPRSSFERFVEQVRQAPVTREEPRAVHRMLFSQTSFCAFDRQGRILVPEGLKAQAGIEREVTLVGVADHIEVWDRKRWQDYRRANDPRFESLAETIFPGPGT